MVVPLILVKRVADKSYHLAPDVPINILLGTLLPSHDTKDRKQSKNSESFIFTAGKSSGNLENLCCRE